MNTPRFDDLLLLRKGGRHLTFGGGPSRVAPARTPSEWRLKTEALRAILLQTLGRAPDARPPLALRVEGTVDRGDHLERRISYLVEPDERVAALVLIPKGARVRRPAALCIHSTHDHGMLEVVGRGGRVGISPSANRAYALMLVRRGYIAFAPELLGSGERRFRGRVAFDNQPLFKKHPEWSGLGKDLWDLRAALDVLERIPGVDPRRIASVGHSQGAGLTVHLMALDSRIRAGVANCGWWPFRVSKNPFNAARTSWWTGRPALRPFCWAGKPMPIDLHEVLALSSPRPLLLVHALNDCGFTPREAPRSRSMWRTLAREVGRVDRLLGAPRRLRIELHLKGHDFPAAERALAWSFLDAALGPPPSP